MQIAVCIPCLNEEATVGKVIDDFRRVLPEAKIYVGDNNSRDRTVEIARSRGAEVLSCRRRGKGSAVRDLLDRVAADIYILVDGDDTYRAQDVSLLLGPVREGRADMIIGNRLHSFQSGSFPSLHLAGNKLIRYLTRRLHGVDIPDMLSGYRVMNRALTEEMSLISGGFEIETEINIKSVWLGFRIGSINSEYRPRPAGSASKLKTFQDGYRILTTILMLLREYQPMTMGGLLFCGLNLIALVLLLTGGISSRLPVFGLGLLASLLGAIALAVGIVLNALNISHRESEELIRKLRLKKGGA
jgi:glycosyltransferase involved in cell wall biosynthesis